MYDLTINIETEQSGQSYIPVGIQENLKLAKPDGSYPIIYEKTNKSEFLAFHFLNPEGLTFIHTEWIPASDDQTILLKKEANLTKRIMHIGKKLVSESLLKEIGKPNNFEELAKAYIRVIGDNYKGKLFRCKIIYNSKNYTTFPNYVPFIESMSVPMEKSNLKIGGDDKVVKTKADVITSRPNPFSVEDKDIPNVDPNQLPF